MTVLVTGAKGMVGSRVVARLKAAGKPVVGVAREQVDLKRDPQKLTALIAEHGATGVIHCAAMTDVDACEADPQGAWAVNVESVAAAARAGVRLTALSTDYVFDGSKGDYSEEDVPNPRGVYARTKRAGEEAALLLAKDAALCRVAVIYSGYQTAKRTYAVSATEALLAGKPVKAFLDQVVSPTLADNAAEMVIGVHQSGENGIFHCSGATAVTRVDFCHVLARKLGADPGLVQPVRLADLKLPAPRPLKCSLRVAKVQKLLGASVPLSLDAALDRFLEERRA
jgi:dTDP-4-dehydrorhamnose reductase